MQAIENARRAMSLLSLAERRRWVLLVPLGMLSAALEAAAAGAIFALAAVLSDTSRVASLPLIAKVYAHLPQAWREESFLLGLFLVLAAGLFVFKTAVTFVAIAYNNKIIAQDRARFATRMFRGYLRLPYAIHLQRHMADNVHRIEASVETVFGHVLWHSANVGQHLMTVLGLLVVMLFADPVITVGAGAFVAVSVLVLSRALRRYQVRLGTASDHLNRLRERALHEGLGAVREVQVLGCEPYFTREFARMEDGLVDVRYRGATALALPRVLNESIFVFAMLGIVAFTLGGVALDPHLLPLLGLYAYAGLRVMPAGNGIIDSIHQIHNATYPLDALLADHRLMQAGAERRADGAADIRTFERELILEDVSFRYTEHGDFALKSIHLVIKRGECVGILGPTGAGKTTLLYLIAGLLEPTDGRIIVDGADLHDHLTAWQQRLGYVPQFPYLRDDSLRRNVAFGLADAKIDEEHVRAAVRRAGLDEFVTSLPRGLDTTVGQNGKRLSGGQRQRVAVARALYDDPDVLLLDEPFSAVDLDSEREMIATLDRLRGRKTVMLISHRLTLTAAACSRLVRLDKGRIRAVGTPAEILDKHETRGRVGGAAGH